MPCPAVETESCAIHVEAIVDHSAESPVALQVVNGDILIPHDFPAEYAAELNSHRPRLKRAIAAVGGVILPALSEWPVGTAWLIGPNLAITNRHVAQMFPSTKPGPGQVMIDFFGEINRNNTSQTGAPVGVKEVRYRSPENEEDFALLILENSSFLPEPLALASAPPSINGVVITIGFPGIANEQDAEKAKEIFGIRHLKYVTVGRVMAPHPSDTDNVLQHNCSTLRGSSGSLVFDLARNCPVGLHYGGHSKLANYAVRTSFLHAWLACTEVSLDYRSRIYWRVIFNGARETFSLQINPFKKGQPIAFSVSILSAKEFKQADLDSCGVVGVCNRGKPELLNWCRQYCNQRVHQSIADDNTEVFASKLIAFACDGKHKQLPSVHMGTLAQADGPTSFTTKNLAVARTGTARVQFGPLGAVVAGPAASATAKPGYVGASVSVAEAKVTLGPVNAAVGLNLESGVGIENSSLKLGLLGFGISIGAETELRLPLARLGFRF